MLLLQMQCQLKSHLFQCFFAILSSCASASDSRHDFWHSINFFMYRTYVCCLRSLETGIPPSYYVKEMLSASQPLGNTGHCKHARHTAMSTTSRSTDCVYWAFAQLTATSVSAARNWSPRCSHVIAKLKQ